MVRWWSCHSCAKVTLLEYLPAIVPLEDAEVSKELERTFKRRGINVITNARFDAASVIAGDDGVTMTVGPDGGQAAEIAAEMLLVAAGRQPSAALARDGSRTLRESSPSLGGSKTTSASTPLARLQPSASSRTDVSIPVPTL